MPCCANATTAAEVAHYHEEGYLIKRGLFSPAEVTELGRHFDAIGAKGEPIPNYWQPDTSPAGRRDPLRRYPRVMMPHRYDELSRRTLLDERLHETLVALMDEEPIACQSMFYFKPCGARGQAFHQDNYYLEARPHTCVAAWLAVDPALPENGGLWVVPRTHRMDIVCPERANLDESFVQDLVAVPAGCQAVPANLAPGDVLFFNGSVIHGSQPNRHPTQWRRSFICHYIPASTQEVSKWYFPLLDFAGKVVERRASAGGGPCGQETKVSSYAKA